MIKLDNEYIIVNVDNGEVKRVKGSFNLSPNFKVREFTSPGNDVVLYSQFHINNLQSLRDHYEMSITVTSGFRDLKENIRVGGYSKSKHPLGLASDIVIAGKKSSDVKFVASKIFGWQSEVITYENTNHTHVASRCKHKRLFFNGKDYIKIDF